MASVTGAGLLALKAKNGVVFGEFLSQACMVDANGDGVLDSAGLVGQPTSSKLPLTFIDGRNGKVLWSGGEYDLYTTFLCLRPDAIALDRKDFTVDLRQPKAPEAVTRIRVDDRTFGYGVASDCFELVASTQKSASLSFEGKPVPSCEISEKRNVHAGAGFVRSGLRRLRAETVGEITYVLAAQSQGTPFVTVAALRGPLPRDAGGSELDSREFLDGLPSYPKVWSLKLPYVSVAHDLPLVIAGQTLVTWAKDPAVTDAGGMIVGIDASTGTLKYAKPQSSSSTWTTQLRELHYDGAHVVAVWGFGLHAYDPVTGDRVWNIGGR
jgi:hypothetical protein